jgi:hypothetical protein
VTALGDAAPVSVSLDPRDGLIANCVRGRTFVDVGGLWGTHGEKVSVAYQAGALSVAMADTRPFSDPLWHALIERLRSQGMKLGELAALRPISAPLDMLVGEQWDVVHCSGVLYHLPDPIAGLRQLRAITRERCILGSMVAPPGEGTVFVPLLRHLVSVATFPDGLEPIYRDWFRPIVGDGALGVTVDASWLPGDYDPWWWIPSREDLVQWADGVGFRVLSVTHMLQDRAVVLELAKQ